MRTSLEPPPHVTRASSIKPEKQGRDSSFNTLAFKCNPLKAHEICYTARIKIPPTSSALPSLNQSKRISTFKSAHPWPFRLPSLQGRRRPPELDIIHRRTCSARRCTRSRRPVARANPSCTRVACKRGLRWLREGKINRSFPRTAPATRTPVTPSPYVKAALVSLVAFSACT